MRIILFVLMYAKKCLPSIIRLAFSCIIIYIASIIVPYTTGKYIDSLTNVNDYRTIWFCVGILAIIWTIQLLFSYIKNMTFTKTSSRISYYIEADIIEHVKRLPLSFFIDNDGAYIGHRIISDSLTVTQFVLLSVVNLVTDILSFIVSSVAIIVISPYIFIIIVATLPLYVVVYLKFRKQIYELGYEFREHENRFFSNVSRQLSSIKPVKQHVYYNRLHDEMRTAYDKLYSATVKHARFGYLFRNVEAFLCYIISLTIFVFSGYGILNGTMSIGDFTMINSYTVMTISALSGILGFGRSYRNTLVSYNRIKDLYDLEVEHNGVLDPGIIESIQIDNLSFGFNERVLIKNVSFTMTKGHIYGILGLNGSGKTTLIDLITGIIDGYSGAIRYNGFDLRDIDIYKLRQEHISIVEQEPSLFFDSIEKIVSEFCNDTAKQQLLNRLGMCSFVTRLGCMDLKTEAEACSFSGGEKQKIALARALAKDADVIILDEPNSAIDSISLEQLVSILKEQAKNRITILITHDPRLIAICEDIIYL